MASPNRNIFVGREPETAELRLAFDDMLAGHGQVVLVSGDPGIGKTHLCDQFRAYAQQQNSAVYWAWCAEDEGAPPLWPWIQVVRSHIARSGKSFPNEELPPGAKMMAEIIPELNVVRQPGSPPLYPEQAQFLLFDAFSRMLISGAADKPITIVLEDLHASDPSALHMLEFLAREISDSRILIIGTYRDTEVTQTHPLSSTIASLSRLTWAEKIDLHGLDPKSINSILEATTNQIPTPELSHEVYENTEGNPLFATEIARALKQGEYVQGGRLPERVSEVILRRLTRVSKDTQRALAIAAIVGREFKLILLSQLLTDLNENQILHLLEEATASRLIDETPNKVGTYRFSHALVQLTLTDEMPPTQKVQAHAAIAKVLEKSADPSLAIQASELAFHYVRAEPILGTEKATNFSLIAGHQALSTHAYDEAIAHFERGLAALGNERSPRVAEANAGLAESLFAQIRPLEGWKLLQEAFELYLDLGQTQSAVEIAMIPFTAGGLSGVDEFYTKALELVDDGSLEAGWLHARLAIGQFDVGMEREAADNLDRGLTIAKASNNVALEARLSIHYCQLYWCADDPESAVTWGLKAARLAEQVDDVETRLRIGHYLFNVLVPLGKLDDASDRVEEQFRVAYERSVPFHIQGAFDHRWMLARMRGDWHLAEEILRENEELNYDFQFQFAQLNRYAVHIDQHGLEIDGQDFREWQTFFKDRKFWRDQGITDPALALFNHVADIHELHPMIRQQLAWMTSQNPNAQRKNRENLVLGLLAASAGNDSEARDIYSKINSITKPIDGTLDLSIERVRGLLSLTFGDHEQAFTHFQRALDICEDCGYKSELARIYADFAEALQTHGQRQHVALAKEIADRGLRITEELQMRPLIQRISSVLERQGHPDSNDHVAPGGLTARELEILELLAAGRTNQQIAENLVLSPYTVSNHVSNIYRKLSVSNRAEATAFALRNGISV